MVVGVVGTNITLSFMYYRKKARVKVDKIVFVPDY